MEKRQDYLSISEFLDAKLSRLSDTTAIALRDLDQKLENRFEKLENQIERVEERITEKLELQVDNKLMQHQMTCQAKCQEQPKESGAKVFWMNLLKEAPSNLKYVLGLIAILSVFYPSANKPSEKTLEDFRRVDSIVKMLEKPEMIKAKTDCIKVKGIEH